MRAIAAVTTPGETAALCHSVGLARASFYRRRRPTPSLPPPPSRAPSPRALAADERQAMLDTLHSERFVDQSPAEVHATLLEEQTYLGSVRTMYRVLAEAHEVRERRAQARHPVYTKPELVATGPNQVWSWDITKLKGPIPYLYYSLYVILDLFSRYVVGWMVARHENAHLAERLIAATCLKQGIAPQQLTIHADRGAPMRSKLVALLFSDLSINASHSRPRVSNDNPFSESQFRTLKYRPEFPDRFGSLEHARGVSRDLFAWYNNAHHHSGLSYLTPADVHYGRAATVLAVRHRTRLAAYAAHPERFVQGPPRPETLERAPGTRACLRSSPARVRVPSSSSSRSDSGERRTERPARSSLPLRREPPARLSPSAQPGSSVSFGTFQTPSLWSGSHLSNLSEFRGPPLIASLGRKLPRSSPTLWRSRNHSLSDTSLFRPGTFWTYRALTTCTAMPRASRISYTGIQYTPVASSATVRTRQASSQSAS